MVLLNFGNKGFTYCNSENSGKNPYQWLVGSSGDWIWEFSGGRSGLILRDPTIKGRFSTVEWTNCSRCSLFWKRLAKDIFLVNCVRKFNWMQFCRQVYLAKKIKIYCTVLLKGKWGKIANLLLQIRWNEDVHQHTGGRTNFVQFGSFLPK